MFFIISFIIGGLAGLKLSMPQPLKLLFCSFFAAYFGIWLIPPAESLAKFCPEEFLAYFPSVAMGSLFIILFLIAAIVCGSMQASMHKAANYLEMKNAAAIAKPVAFITTGISAAIIAGFICFNISLIPEVKTSFPEMRKKTADFGTSTLWRVTGQVDRFAADDPELTDKREKLIYNLLFPEITAEKKRQEELERKKKAEAASAKHAAEIVKKLWNLSK